MKPVAVVTMVYNEDVFLPIWVKYYGDLFGRENLYVLDNQSDDGSTSNLGDVNVIRIPWSFEFNKNRRRFISQFCNALLIYFDTVIYTDCDEILLAGKKIGTLKDFVEQMNKTHATALGFELFQDIEREAPLDLSRPILEQRKKIYFSAPMCKTLVIRKPITWSAGFHHASRRPSFGGLFLLHLSNMDLDIRLKRQALMRTLELKDLGPHKRAPDAEVLQLFKRASLAQVSELRCLNEIRKAIQESVEFFPKTGFYGVPRDARRSFPFRVFYLRGITNLVIV